MKGWTKAAAAALLLTVRPAAALDSETPTMARYLPLYPGLYLELDLMRDPRDRVFDAQGHERNTATPGLAEATRFPLTQASARFTWTFPLFESQDIPFFSSRLHTARATLRYLRTQTRGGLAAYDDADADEDIANHGSGVGDTTLEFGSFLWGGGDWRGSDAAPGNAGLLLLGINVPTGVYEHEAPINAGSNHWAFQARLGTAWRPWSTAILEAGAGYRMHLRNYEAQYGSLAPTEQGDEAWLDLSLSQRLLPGLHLGLGFTERRGEPNRYEDPRFAPNGPPPPSTVPPSSTAPTPGTYEDDGTALRTLGVALHYFLGQRWLASLSWTHPLSGESGEFDLPYTDRRPAGCIDGAASCTTSPGGSARVDGLGPARSYASDRWQLGLRYNFGQGDAFTCVGCSR